MICGGSVSEGKSGGKPQLTQKMVIPNNAGKRPEDTYQIEKTPIGEGAFGSVKKCSRKGGTTLAMKNIKKNRLVSVSAFQNEIDIQLALDHPNVVRLYEVYEDRREIFLVMDMCTGGEMFDLIIAQTESSKMFGEKDVAFLLNQMLRAIFYMHSKWIAHRDLKPENFLLLEKDVPLAKNTLKLIDFGISKRFEPGRPMKTVAGTHYYIAPEVLQHRYDEKCDVWSCGVMMYILLCGLPPFGGDTDSDILAAVTRARLSFSEQNWKGVSSEAKAFISSMCQKDVKKRMSAQQACEHPWLLAKKEDVGAVTKDQSMSFSDNLRKFSGVGRFKKTALHFIAHRLSDKNITKIREAFLRLDKNGDGKLTLKEINEGFQNAGLAEISDLEKHFKQVDADASGSIDYTEFIAAMMQEAQYLQEDVCWEAFRVFDRNGDGKISKNELAQVLADESVQSNTAADTIRVADIMQSADTNGDGEIDFEEFMGMLRTQ